MLEFSSFLLKKKKIILTFSNHQKRLQSLFLTPNCSLYKVPVPSFLGDPPVTTGRSYTMFHIWNTQQKPGPGSLPPCADPEVFTELWAGPCGTVEWTRHTFLVLKENAV